MANLFDAADAPEVEPLKFVLGDFVQWKKTNLVTDYPLASYSAQYISRISGGGNTEFAVVATEVDGTYLFTISSAESAAFTAGDYHWQLEIIKASDSSRIVLARGDWSIIVDLDVDGSDPRSHAQIMVEKIESILQGKADSDVGSYSIAGRSLTKMSFAELMEARDRYKSEYAQELIHTRIQAEKPSGATVKVRFS
ncbi:MAG: hypothetical protein O2910_08110 [Proteobacteria bacterium]|nr:hypothetical protein [Pseudomonadota bacterium]